MGCINSNNQGDTNVHNDPDVYRRVDEHARKAPSSLKNSPKDLVAYLSKPSKEPIMVARAIFVWISENIRYDVDGFFGRSKRTPSDAESVMKNGIGVCEGYANVVALLCREAEIPVKKISGFSKGYGTSAEKEFSTSFQTDHAWNAVELSGKWHLVDSTWGAGNLDTKTNSYKKSFNDFYFLTDPKHLIYSHFPYMNGDMQESMKWQLLDKPVTLEGFNKLVKIKPHAFVSGVRPVSHKQGLVKMSGEIEMKFKYEGGGDFVFSSKLMIKQDNMLYEQQFGVFDRIEDGVLKTRIHPNKPGTYRLTFFGGKDGENRSMPELFEYTIKCEKSNGDFEFPYVFVQSQVDRCTLNQPLQHKLKQNSSVEFHLTSPYITRVMVNQIFLEKNGKSFKGVVKTGPKGSGVTVFGSRDTEGRLKGLYQFEIV